MGLYLAFGEVEKSLAAFASEAPLGTLLLGVLLLLAQPDQALARRAGHQQGRAAPLVAALQQKVRHSAQPAGQRKALVTRAPAEQLGKAGGPSAWLPLSQETQRGAPSPTALTAPKEHL